MHKNMKGFQGQIYFEAEIEDMNWHRLNLNHMPIVFYCEYSFLHDQNKERYKRYIF